MFTNIAIDVMALVEKILEILQAQAENTVDLIDIALSDRSTSYRKARGSLLQGPPEFKTDWAWAYRQRRIFYATVNRLKRQGLIAGRKRGRRSVWKITKRGISWWKFLQKKRSDPFSLLHRDTFEGMRRPGITSVAFDIPERERRKRKWLRDCLKLFDFSCLQKSVWIGKRQLPEEFIHALRERDLLKYVQIFAISRAGTIETVDKHGERSD